MEETITVDGRQFKLSTDRPLTATEKVQTIAEIRKQTGCGTCGGQKTIANMSTGDDWQYGGIRSLAPNCVTTNKGSGATVTLEAAPRQGVQPYSVLFLKAPPNSYNTTGSDAVTIAIGSLTNASYLEGGVTTTMSANPTLKVIDEAPNATTPMVHAEYVLGDSDVAGATIKGADTTATIIFKTTVLDSCPTASGGAQTCSEICKVGVTCIPPTCNFIVS